MSDNFIVSVDAQMAARVPRFLASRAADIDTNRGALARAEFEIIRVAAHGMKRGGRRVRFCRDIAAERGLPQPPGET